MYKHSVSIVLPCKNGKNYINDCISSIYRQNYKNYEIIFVDDGSTDGSLDVLAEFQTQKLKVFRFERSVGIARALNFAMSEATGDYIARMDIDDIMWEPRLDDQVRILDSDQSIDILGSGADVFGEFSTTYRSPLHHENIFDGFLVNNPMIHPTVMFRRNLYDLGEYKYDESIFADEDYCLWAKLLHTCKFANCDFSTIRYRVTQDGNQWHIGTHAAKMKALGSFLEYYSLDYHDAIVEVLAEFQMAKFVDKSGFDLLRAYAADAERLGMAKLGRYQSLLTSSIAYSEFNI